MTLSPTATNYYIKEIIASGRKLTAFDEALITSAKIAASREQSLSDKQSNSLIKIYERVTDAKLTFKPVRK